MTNLIEYISSQDDFSSVSDKKNYVLVNNVRKKWDFGSNGRGEIRNVTLWNWEVVSNNFILKLN